MTGMEQRREGKEAGQVSGASRGAGSAESARQEAIGTRRESYAGRTGWEEFSSADTGEEARTKILNAPIPLPPETAFRILIPLWGGSGKVHSVPLFTC